MGRFTFRKKKYSAKRKKAIEIQGRKKNYGDRIWEICETAEKIIPILRNPENIVLIQGQGMRPIYEAMKGLIEINHALGRRRLKYIVPPSNYGDVTGITNRHLVSEMKRRLLAKGAIPKGKRRIYVVDFHMHGRHTIDFTHDAIKEINPEAEVIEINQDSKEFHGSGVWVSEFIERPTEKDSKGGLKGVIASSYRRNFLLFQHDLREHLESKAHNNRANN